MHVATTFYATSSRLVRLVPLSLALSIAPLGSAWAQSITGLPASEEAAMETLIVTGTRLNTPASQVGTSVSIITDEELARRGYDFAIDAIAAAPGVTVNQNGAFGGVATVRIRGAASEQTLVLIDGVPVNDPTSPGGGFDFASLDTADIRRIEVLRGPQSVLWGSDAIGGVLNIITRRPDQTPPLTAFVESGSFATLRGGAAVSGSGEQGDFRIGLTGFSTDGISRADEADGNTETDGFDTYTLNARGGLKLPGDVRVEATLRRVEGETAFDGFGGETGVIDSDDSSKTAELSTTLTLRAPSIADDRFDLLAMIGYSGIERDNFNGGVNTFSSEGQRLISRVQGTLSLFERHRVALGAEREESAANGEETAIDGLFALWEYAPTESLTLSAGIRNDDHEQFGSETTRRASVAFAARDDLNLRASWGEGFKAPTIFQTTFFCCGATAPNADLQAETSESWDVGFDWQIFRRGQLSVTWFDQDFENLIDFAFDIGGYRNIAVAETQGVEIEGRYQLTDLLGVGVGYTYLEARDGTGNRLARLPQNSGDLEFTFTPRGDFSGSIVLRYNGDEDDSRGVVQRWLRVDASARYSLGERYELFARIENATDTQYQQVFGYGTPGLSGTLGFRARL
jgi:vitamin B12 transporter